MLGSVHICFLCFRRGLVLIVSQDEDMPNNVDLFIAPPGSSVLTDEDSAGEDEGGLLDNPSGRQLMASAEIKLPNNNIISTFPATGCNESTAHSSDHSSADQKIWDLPSTTPPSDITTVGRPDNSSVPRIFLDTNGDIPLASTKSQKY